MACLAFLAHFEAHWCVSANPRRWYLSVVNHMNTTVTMFAEWVYALMCIFDQKIGFDSLSEYNNSRGSC